VNSINWVASEAREYSGSHLGMLLPKQDTFEEWIGIVMLIFLSSRTDRLQVESLKMGKANYHTPFLSNPRLCKDLWLA
jgi:hypothetical protein